MYKSLFSQSTLNKLSLIWTIVIIFIVTFILIYNQNKIIQDFSLISVGIIIQAFPFLLIGTIVSSLISSYVSDETIIKFFPKKGILSSVSAIASGIFLPLCDCAVIPVAARLRKKGVPIHAVVTFMMSAPIVNPIVILSTIYAFPGSNIVYYRIIAGVLIALFTGLFLKILYKDSNKLIDFEILKLNDNDFKDKCCDCHNHEEVTLYKNDFIKFENRLDRNNINIKHDIKNNDCSMNKEFESNNKQNLLNNNQKEKSQIYYEEVHNHKHIDIKKSEINLNKKISHKEKIINSLIHAGNEFFDVSKLFIIGVFITAFIQISVPKTIVSELAGGTFTSIIFMMILSFLMSICSTSDAFIARSFLNTVPMSGIFGFIVFGPVLDLKNTLIMTAYFKKKFVFNLIAVAFITALTIISIFSLIIF